MAKSVLELAVGTGQWDAGLKKAKSALDSFVSAQGGIQQALEKDSENVKKFVQMMGNMESSAKTVKGQMNDYKSAIEQLTLQYKDLTDAQKKSIGQVYLKSIDQLKTKFKEATNTAGELKNELNGTGGLKDSLDAVAGKFGLNITQLTKFGGAAAAVTAALKVTKDAFFSNEEELDEWGRIVESSKSLYNGFLDALNTGDIGGYLQNIGKIVQSARDAYDALDELNTFNAFNQRNIARTRREMTESIADFREGKATKEDVRAAGDAYKEELRQRMKLENDAYVKAVKNLAKQRGVNEQDLMVVMSGKYGDYKTLKEAPLTGVKSSLQFLGPGQAQTVTTAIPANETERLGAALRRLNDTELESLQALGAKADQTGDDIAQVDKQLSRILNGRGGSSGGGGNTTKELTPLQEAQKKITDLTNEALTADEERRNVIKEEIAGLQKQVEEYKKIQDYVTGKRTDPRTDIQKKISELSIEALTADEERRNVIKDEIVGLQKQVDKYNEIYNIISGKFDPTKIKAPQPTAYSALPLVENDSYTTARLSSLNSTYQSAMSRSDIGSAEFNMAWEHMVDATALTNLIQTAIKNGISLEGMEVPNLMDKLVSAEGLSNEQLQALVDYINQFMGENPIKLNFATGSVEGVKDLAKEAKVNMDAWNKAASAVNSMGSALQSLEDPSAKIAGIVAQAVANIALGFAQATASQATGAAGVWGWIAAATAGLATMTATIQQIKSVTKGGFAEGGIVPGNSFSGDLLRTSDYGINSGELILNRSQQNSIAAQLQTGGLENLQLYATISGEDIEIALESRNNRIGNTSENIRKKIS